nr:Diaminopimelate decarboxylase [Streptococcus thermophilus]
MGRTVAVIGGGPRGLWAAEELFELARQRGVAIDLTVFTDGSVGARNAYELDQPEQWVLNVPHSAIRSHRHNFEGFSREDEPASRSTAGEFLRQAWRDLQTFAPRNCTIAWQRTWVKDIRPRGEQWEVEGTLFDEILLTTGHAVDWPGSLAHADLGLGESVRVIAPATPQALATVAPDDVVVVRGAALTFIDITRVIGAQAIYPVTRSGRFMEAKHEPTTVIDDLVHRAQDAIRAAARTQDIVDALAECAAGILERETGHTDRDAVEQVLAGTDQGDPVEDFRRSVTEAITPAHAVGIAFRKAYPAVIERASFGGRESFDSFGELTRRLERIAFGPFAGPAADLLDLIDKGIVRTDILDRGGNDADLAAAAREVGATVVIDGVIASPGVVPGTLVADLVDRGIGTVDPETNGLIIDRDATITGQRHIAAAGRMTEGWVLGLDTLNRTQHDEIPRWARRVVTEAMENPERVHGVPPMTARIEPWAEELTSDYNGCRNLLEEFSSPVNVLNPEPMLANVDELVSAGASMGVEVKVFFARKANKGLVFVDTMRNAGHGVDVASENELRQVLNRGVPGERIILSAAIKSDALLELAVANGVVISADNVTELERIIAIASGRTALVAPRLAPDPETMPPTRFGERSHVWAQRLSEPSGTIRVAGVHVHLHGYAAADRSAALRECVGLVDKLRASGHDPQFIDVGGGVPMSYLDDEEQWNHAQDSLRAMREGYAEPFTWKGDPLLNTYPYWQRPVRGAWLRDVLADGVAQELTSRGLRLHLEPGRSLLDGCGLILATVEFTKHRSDGLPLVGLAMNRTQCRTTSDDYLVDPILVTDEPGSSDEEVEAFLVGAYCIEDEVILRRRIRFPRGVRAGDIVAIPNTAGYFMHILESASHQIPLAKNVVWPSGVLDAIDER